MIKYYSNADGAEEMSKTKFEKTFKHSLSNSKFDKLTDVIFAQYANNIYWLIDSTDVTFKQILNSDFNASVGFKGPAVFYIDDKEYAVNDEYVIGQSFQLSIRKEGDKTIIRFYTNNDCEGDHIAAIVDKQIRLSTFIDILKDLIRYFIVLNIHNENFFEYFTDVDSMQYQNILNTIAIESLD